MKQHDENGKRSGASGSLVLSSLAALSNRISISFSSSSVGKLFSSASYTDKLLKDGGIAGFFGLINFSDGWLRPLKTLISRGTERSFTVRLLRKVVSAMLCKPVRSYGLLFFFLGLFGGAVFALEHFGLIPVATELPQLITCACLLLFGFPLLFSNRTAVELLEGSAFFHILFISRLGLEEQKLSRTGRGSTDGALCFLIALLISALSIFLPLYIMLAVAAAIITILLLIGNPEVGLTAALVLLPLASPKFLLALAALTAVSYLLKLIRGKRNFSLTVQDVFVLMLIIFRCLLALLGSGLPASELIMMFCYFAAVNLLRTAKLLRRAVGALCGGAFVAALLRLSITISSFFGLSPIAVPDFLSESLFAGDYLAWFLATVLPMAAACFVSGENPAYKNRLFFTMLVIAGCAALVGGSGLWTALAAGLLLFLLLAFRSRAAIICAGCVLLPLTYALGELFFIPSPVGQGSMYLSFSDECGAVGVMVVVLILIFVFQAVFSTKRDIGIKPQRYWLCGVAASLMLFVFGGLVADLWQDTRLIMLFWVSCGMIGAQKFVFGERSIKDYER